MPASIKRPLIIACSGGGGHIAAAQGIITDYIELYGLNLDITDYKPKLYEKKKSFSQNKISASSNLQHLPYLGKLLRRILSSLYLPLLPNVESLDKEVKTLSLKEQKISNRKYIDMLLDVYPDGFEAAALWNLLQRSDQTDELRKLISLQLFADKSNHSKVYNYYLKLLRQAALNGTPYTEIISTQAMALASLCDVARDYNLWLKQQKIDGEELVVNQYLTDLPTKGAVHFFSPLLRLSETQQKQMRLHGVGLDQKAMGNFFPKGHHFADIVNIDLHQNPMVRKGFKNFALDNSANFEQSVTLSLKGESKPIALEAHEQIACIMLGSQASNDCYEYIESLLQAGVQKIFVFGGQDNESIAGKIANFIKKNSEYEGRIFPLPQQSDIEIMPLMTRSNIVIIRGGGLSVIEQLAMKHNKQQTLLFHHADSEGELSSGIPWEDKNVETLMKNLAKQGVHSEKTSIVRAKRHLMEARLIAGVKKLAPKIDIEDAIHHIKNLSDEGLSYHLELFKAKEKEPKPTLHPALEAYFINREKLAKTNVTEIQKILLDSKKVLIGLIAKELKSNEFKTAELLQDFATGALKHKSYKLNKSLATYNKIQALENIINDNNDLSANKQLLKLKSSLEETVWPKDSFLRQMLIKITALLASYFKYFKSKHESQQEVKTHTENTLFKITKLNTLETEKAPHVEPINPKTS